MAAEISANSRFRQTREFSRFELSFGKLAIASLPNNVCITRFWSKILSAQTRLSGFDVKKYFFRKIFILGKIIFIELVLSKISIKNNKFYCMKKKITKFFMFLLFELCFEHNLSVSRP